MTNRTLSLETKLSQGLIILSMTHRRTELYVNVIPKGSHTSAHAQQLNSNFFLRSPDGKKII